MVATLPPAEEPEPATLSLRDFLRVVVVVLAHFYFHSLNQSVAEDIRNVQAKALCIVSGLTLNSYTQRYRVYERRLSSSRSHVFCLALVPVDSAVLQAHDALHCPRQCRRLSIKSGGDLRPLRYEWLGFLFRVTVIVIILGQVRVRIR